MQALVLISSPQDESVYNNTMGGRLSFQVMVVSRNVCRAMAQPSR